MTDTWIVTADWGFGMQEIGRVKGQSCEGVMRKARTLTRKLGLVNVLYLEADRVEMPAAREAAR